ncbi:MAG: hypothetical protein A2583_15910 [Bdellovibrionales bacterium RIFOXYD1_FULL_53_11]|nr:MAG: hypothetical protein A2583_15910 [Bdellovibrionales bacterium RIFOXYD1_FULL_53_11]
MIFFTADHHFYHSNIIRFCSRPFATVEEMNEELIKRWNAVVAPDDTVYHLGDFSLAYRPVELFAPRLHGEKHLIMGNHDLCHPRKKKKAAIGGPIYERSGFKTLELERTMVIAGETVLLNHFPYLSTEEAKPEFQVKFQSLRPKDMGKWLLHGHIHEKWKVKGRMINVSVDVWDFYPVPITEIEKIIQA